ncbi:MAG: hypothetical protein JST85_07090 [Acidobacteria bacterium]|nr:hypothetical protein [Acidobacteriota bacterium]
MKTIRSLLENLIDYAGLFPPAELPMAKAVKNYAAYCQSEYSWMLGKFIVPASRLEEFEQAAAEFWPQDSEAGFWKLSALGGTNLQDDLATINRFSRRHSFGEQAAAVMVDTIEFKASTVEEIQTAMRVMHPTLTCFVEIPIHNDPTELIQAIGEQGAFAKVRTGGVMPDAFPSSQNLARFIATCAEEDVGFKATAGLHHPLRSVNRLTYKPDSASAMMHGFLNVFLAAAFAQSGASIEQLIEILEETSLEAFRFEERSVMWRDEMLVVGHIRNARHLFSFSFGSCSFTEPIEDLQRLQLL